jgi:hypothetical protein
MDPFSPHYRPPCEPRPHFLSAFFPDGLPGTYLVLDVDTSGVDPAVDRVVGVGSLQVIDNKVEAWRHSLLNWHGLLDQQEMAWLGQRLAQVPGRLLRVEDLWECGNTAAHVLRTCVQTLSDLPPDVPVVGHTLVRMKWPLLLNNLRRYAGGQDVPAPALLDVGLLQKALGADWYPTRRESLADFQERVNDRPAKGVSWSLTYCMHQHHLEPGVPPSDPRYKLLAVHQLYQAHRRVTLPAGRR